MEEIFAFVICGLMIWILAWLAYTVAKTIYGFFSTAEMQQQQYQHRFIDDYRYRPRANFVPESGDLELLRWNKAELVDKVFKDLMWILTSSGHSCNRAVSFLISKMKNQKFIGLDIEWDPFPSIVGQTCPTALIQLGVHTGHCLLYQVNGNMELPHKLQELLCNPEYLKVGVGIEQDMVKLWRDFNVMVKGALDLRSIAPRREKMGLAALVGDHLHVTLPKYLSWTTKWSKEVLSQEEQTYAAIDAYAAALLAQTLAADELKMWTYQVDRNHILHVKSIFEERYGEEWWRKTHKIREYQ